MLLEPLVDVENSVAWLIKSREQLVHDDQDVGFSLGAEVINSLAFVVFRIAAHIVLPPLLHLRQFGFVHIGVAFPGVGWRNYHGAGDKPGGVQRLFVAHGREFAVGGELPFQAKVEVEEVRLEVNRNVPGDQVNPVGRTIDRALFPIFCLQITLLLVGQAKRYLFKPIIDGGFIDVENGLALFIQQGRYRAVFGRVAHGVGVDDLAKFVGGLVVLQQWRAGEGDVGGVWQSLLHPLMVFAALAPVAFVDQHNQVGAIIPAFGQSGGAGEFVDDRENDPFTAFADPPRKIAARRGFRSCAILLCANVGPERATGHKVARELLFKVAPVGDDDHTAIFQGFIEQQCLAEIHHREALA